MRRMTRYSRFEQELPPIGSPATTRDGKYGEVIAHEGAQVRLQFAGSIQGLYFPDEITVEVTAATEVESKWQTQGAELHLAEFDYPELQQILAEPAPQISQSTAPGGAKRVSIWGSAQIEKKRTGLFVHCDDCGFETWTGSPDRAKEIADDHNSTQHQGSKTAAQYGEQFWSEVDHKWYDVRDAATAGGGRFVVVQSEDGRYAVADTKSRECSGGMSRADAESASIRWSQNPGLSPWEFQNDYSGLFDNLTGSKTAGPGSSKTGASYEDLNIARDFLHDNWDDIYNVTKDRDMDGYRSVWSTTLHGPDGDKVWVGIKDDGTPVDLTKRGSKTAAHEYHCTRCGTRLVKGKYEIAPTHCLGVANGHDWEEGPVKTAATDDDAYTPPTPTTHRYELSGCVNQWLPDHDHADCWRAFMKHQGRPEGTSYSEYYASKTAAFDPNKHWCQGTGQFPKADGGCPTCFEKHPELSASGAIKAHNPTSVWDTGHSDSIPPFVR